MEIEIVGKVVHIYCVNEAEAKGMAKGIKLAQQFMKALSNGD